MIREHDEKKRLADEVAKQEKDAINNALLDQKAALLLQRKELAAFKEKMKGIASHVQNDPKLANSELLKLLKDNFLANHDKSIEYNLMLFYLYKHNSLTDKMLDLCHTILNQIEFSEEYLQLYYDIAILQEEAGDPVLAFNIYKQFIDNMYIDYMDVTDKYNKLK